MRYYASDYDEPGDFSREQRQEMEATPEWAQFELALDEAPDNASRQRVRAAIRKWEDGWRDAFIERRETEAYDRSTLYL
jgi:hypothetical protein